MAQVRNDKAGNEGGKKGPVLRNLGDAVNPVCESRWSGGVETTRMITKVLGRVTMNGAK